MATDGRSPFVATQSDFVQVVITSDQALLLAIVAGDASTSQDVSGSARDNLQRLSVFFSDVAVSPERYPVRVPEARETIKAILRSVEGPAQPQPANKRKAHQESRMSFHKRRRRDRQAQAAIFNDEREALEEEEQLEQELYLLDQEQLAFTLADGLVEP